MELIDTECAAEPPRHTKLYHCATLVGGWQEERQQFTLGMGDQPVDPGAHMDEHTTYTDSYQYPTREELAQAKPPSCFTLEAPRELMFYHGDILNPVKSQIPLSELSWSNRKIEPYTSPQTLEIMGVSRRHALTSAALRSKGMLDYCSVENGTHPAVEKESAYLRSLQRVYMKRHEHCSNNCECPNAVDGHCSCKDVNTVVPQPSKGYTPPGLPPVGRVGERNRLLTTKQVTIDATGLHLRKNLLPYPATSSDCIGRFVKDCGNVMHKTKLRTEWED